MAKNASQIKREMVSSHKNLETSINDYSPTSVIGSIFFAVSKQIEKVYTYLDEIKLQAYIATATGVYLDRLIFGTYGKERKKATRSFGYMVVFGRAPLFVPSSATDEDDIKLYCAIYDPETDVVTGEEVAQKFITSGSNNASGRVFILLAPKSYLSENLAPDGVVVKSDSKGYYISLKGINNPYQYFVLPVVSSLRGESQNVQENAISIFPNAPTEFSGAINSYDLQQQFFRATMESNIPYTARFSNVFSNFIPSNVVNLVNTYAFSPSGKISLDKIDISGRIYSYFATFSDGSKKKFELSYSAKELGKLFIALNLDFNATNDNEAETVLPFVYDGNRNKLFLRKLTLEDDSGVVIDTLVDESTSLDAWNSLKPELITILSNSSTIVREMKPVFDPYFVFDPDGVLDANGRMVDFARIGGAANEENDISYRNSLRSYLASLARATQTSIESGALSVSGVNFAKVINNQFTPSGTTVLLVSGTNGVLPTETLKQIYDTLNPSWKASGTKLIIKPPKLQELTLTMSITIKRGVSKESVRQQVESRFINYLASKIPGDYISYAELLADLDEIPGVINIWNMNIGKMITKDYFSYIKDLEVSPDVLIPLMSGSNLVYASGKLYKNSSLLGGTYVLNGGTSPTKFNLSTPNATWDSIKAPLFSQNNQEFKALIESSNLLFDEKVITLTQPIDKNQEQTYNPASLETNAIQLAGEGYYKFKVDELPVVGYVGSSPAIAIFYKLES